MIAVYILLGLICLHCILTLISKYSKPHHYENRRCLLEWGNNSNLMLTAIHYSEKESPYYSRSIVVDMFGGKIGFTFGKHFNREIACRFYGFQAISGDYIPTRIWTGIDFKSAPWDTSEILIQENYLTEDGTWKSDDEASPFKTLTDTSYQSKDELQHIDKIDFYLCELKWTSKLAKMLGLTSVFFKRNLGLIGHSSQPLGTDTRIAYIKLYTETIMAYDNYAINNTDKNLNRLKKLVDERIGCFMMLDKNY